MRKNRLRCFGHAIIMRDNSETVKFYMEMNIEEMINESRNKIIVVIQNDTKLFDVMYEKRYDRDLWSCIRLEWPSQSSYITTNCNI